jgi:ribosomal-protein-alanine N-acetyltransferase
MSAPPNQPQPPDAGDLRWSRAGATGSGAAAELASGAFDPLFREAWTESQIANLLQAGNGWLDLGHVGQELVVFALNRQVLDEVELLLCAVAPGWRGRGIGRQMMEQVAESARSRGASRLFLEVREGNEAAIALYRSVGFRIEGRRPGYYRTVLGNSIDAITLAMSIQ